MFYSVNGEVTTVVEMNDLGVPNNDEETEMKYKDNLTMCQHCCSRLTNEKQWRVLVAQKDTRVKSKRKKEERDEINAKLFKPYTPRKNQRKSNN